MDDELLTPDEVCAYLKVTKDWLYDQVEARRLPHLHLGRQLRFRRSTLLEFLSGQSVAVDQPDP
jgi:excisionase family DNA binding protein